MPYFIRNTTFWALLLVCYMLPAYIGIAKAEILEAKDPGEMDSFVAKNVYTYGEYKNEHFEIFNKPLFDFHNEKVEPENNAQPLSLSIAASPDEFEPLTFFIRAKNKPIENIRIQVSDLLGKNGNTFSSDNVVTSCVKLWAQAGQWKFIEKTNVFVPELLLYDCCENLESAKYGNVVRLPTISKKLKVNIDVGTAQQFWVTVRVPDNTKPDIYEGQLSVAVNGKKPLNIPFKLCVLPIGLLEPEQEYYIYYKPYPTIPMAIIEKQLIDLREHGVTGVRVPGYRQKEFISFIELAKKHGLKKLIFSSRQCIEKKDIIQKAGFPLICYGIDEPNRIRSKDYKKSLRHHIALSNDIHANGGKVITAILMNTAEMLRDPKSKAYDLFDPRIEKEKRVKKTFRDQNIVTEALDYTVYWVEGLLYENWQNSKSLVRFMDYIKTAEGQKKEKFGKEFYYWQMWKDLPHMNRHLSGFFLWQSGLDGVMPYVYQGRYKFNAYNDRENGRYRQLMVTYPSSEGTISTLKWEEFREGYDDVRYLTTLHRLIEKYETLDSKAANTYANEVEKALAKYNHPIFFKKMNSSDYQDTRKLIICKILELKDKLDKYPSN